MSPKVEKISENSLLIGEGPHWDDRSQALYFVSILENTIHKYDIATEAHTCTTLEGRPGFIVPLVGHLDHQFVVGLEREFVVVQWDGTADNAARVVRLLGEVDHHAVGNRINHGKADPRGRLYAGTMDGSSSKRDPHNGTLYRLDNKGITALGDKITISNGLAWDVTARAMYYIDSADYNIRRYDYDVETGNISNLQYIFDLKAHDMEGHPDGCTIDTDGNLWVAVFGGGCVIQISPRGELLRQVPIPAKQVTSCTFGGPDLNILFVTTARIPMKEEQNYPSGCTFRITNLGVKGHPNVNFKL